MSSAPRLRFDHSKVRDVTLTRTVTVLGRKDECHVTLPHSKVSSRHAEIELKGDAWWVRDLESTNGTFVDGAPCHGSLPLRAGSRIQIGPFFATFDPNPVEEVAAAPATTTAASAPVEREPAPESPRRVSERHRSVSIHPMWAAIVILVCAGGTLWFMKKIRPAPTEPERPPVAQSDPKTGDPPKRPPISEGDTIDGDPERTRSPEDENALDRVQALRGRFKEENAPLAVAEGGGADTDVDTSTPERPTPDRDTSSPRSTTAKPPTKTDEDSAAKEVAPPTPDVVDAALRSGRALAIVRALKEQPKSPSATEAQTRLRNETIYCLHRSGGLGGGDALLVGGIGLTCSPEEKDALIKAAQKTKGVGRVRVEEWKLRVRYSQDYTRGLGRKIGKRRLAPHPKRVDVRLEPITGGGRPLTLEVETPRHDARELGRDGMTEEEVWAETVAAFLEAWDQHRGAG